MSEFLSMGGYAQYVWPAFAVTLVVLIWMAVVSFSEYRRAQRDIAELAAAERPVSAPSPTRQSL